MRTIARFIACAILIVLATSGSTAFARTSGLRPSPRATGGLPVFYVSDAVTSVVNVFRVDTGQQVASIPYPLGPHGTEFGSGAGLATDAQNNLYVGYVYDNGSNFPGRTIIFEFAPGQIRWYRSIAAGCCAVPSLAVSPAGEIAEALPLFGECCAGGVDFVEPGKRYVGRKNGTLGSASWEAYDARGTLWVDGSEGNAPVFGFIRRGSPNLEVVSLDPAPALGPLAVDPANNVLVANDGTLSAYTKLGKLVYQVALTGATGIASIALSSDGTTLFVADKSGIVFAYAFPAGGLPTTVYGVGGSPDAIALGSI